MGSVQTKCVAAAPCSVPVALPAEKVHSSSTVRISTSDDDLPALLNGYNASLNDISSSDKCSNHNDFGGDDDMERKVLSAYRFNRLLGSGSSAQVYEVTHRASSQRMACKIIHRDKCMNDDRTMVAEVGLMKRLRHPNIVELKELYETTDTKWIVMEGAEDRNMQDTLVSLAQQKSLPGEAKPFIYSEATIAQYFRQVLLG